MTITCKQWHALYRSSQPAASSHRPCIADKQTTLAITADNAAVLITTRRMQQLNC